MNRVTPFCIFSLLSIAFFVYLAVDSHAAPPKGDHEGLVAVDVSHLTDGQSLVVTNKGGVFSVRPLLLLTPGDNPVPTPTPTPTPENARSLLFKNKALEVMGDTERSMTAKKLAVLYREESKLARSGQIPDPVSLKAITGMASDLVLKKPSTQATAWQAVRDLLGTQWTILDAKAGGSPISAYADLLDDAATGLEGSSDLKAISPEMIQLIMQIIQLIMKLFFPT